MGENDTGRYEAKQNKCKHEGRWMELQSVVAKKYRQTRAKREGVVKAIVRAILYV